MRHNQISIEMKVQILKGKKTAKEINEVTNPTMGKRHANYENMLRTFEIQGVANNDGDIMPLVVGSIRDAQILKNGKIKIR